MTIEELKAHLIIPVIVAPMFLVSGTALLVACSRNGMLGTMPALNARTTAVLEEQLTAVRHQLEQAGVSLPYGINLIVHKTNQRLQADLEVCIRHRVPVVITSLGAVKEVVDAVHSYGGLVFHDIVNSRHARKAIAVGVDGLIAVTAGAGGHAGTINPFALMQEIRSFYDGPVALAGCINNGRQVRAAELLGADFAYMGTRFIATEESQAQDAYKQMVLQSSIEDILYTNAVSGVPANFMKQSIAQAGVDLAHKKEEDFSKLGGEGSKAWKDIWSAGQGVSGITDIPSVAQLAARLRAEYAG